MYTDSDLLIGLLFMHTVAQPWYKYSTKLSQRPQKPYYIGVSSKSRVENVLKSVVVTLLNSPDAVQEEIDEALVVSRAAEARDRVAQIATAEKLRIFIRLRTLLTRGAAPRRPLLEPL